MKNKIYLFLSILQLVLGAVYVTSFVVLALNDYDVRQYVTTLVIAAFFVVMGIVSIVNLSRKNKQ